MDHMGMEVVMEVGQEEADTQGVDLGTTDPTHHLAEGSQSPRRRQSRVIIILESWLTPLPNTIKMVGTRQEDFFKE
jgi:hypothetical protein